MSLPSTQKQWRLAKAHEKLLDVELVDGPVPQPAHGEVLIKVHAVSMNYRDLMIGRNIYPTELVPDLVPLSDCAGEIVTLGAGVKDWKIGDRVIPSFNRDHIYGKPQKAHRTTAWGASLQGFLQQYAVVPAYCLARLPESWTYEEGATIPCAGVTAYNALFAEKALKGGDTVLIQGTGGVSIFALQIAVACGARVILTSSSDEKLAIGKELGAREFINYRKTPEWQNEVLRLTNDEGVDHIVEIGGAGTLIKSAECVAYTGVISNIGFLAGAGDISKLPMLILMRTALLKGVMVGSRTDLESLIKLFVVNDIKPVVSKAYEFSEAKEAIATFENQQFVGKVVIRVS